MTINEIGQAHGVHPVQVSQWKKKIQEQTKTLFEGKRGPQPVAAHSAPDRLYGEIGRRKMVMYLGRCGHAVNRKRAQRLMRTLGLQGMAPGPNTSRAHSQNKVYAYLLRGIPIVRPKQVWRTDITSIRLALGRAFDNIFVERLWRSVKHEDVYLNGYATMGELLVGLTQYFMFYNGERPHQALESRTPHEVHQSAAGGGAMIVDKYGAVGSLPIALCSTGTAQDKVRLKDSAIPNAKTGAVPSSCVSNRVQLKLSSKLS